jgi:hypothetical protein
MARYLVVAHQTVTNPLLFEQIRKIEQEDPSAGFVLLVPATPVRHLLRRPNELEASEVARDLSEQAIKAFRKNHANLLDAHVGAESPERAIDDEVRASPGYAGFVISTLAEEKSRWLKLDLPALVTSKYGLPVYHVQAPHDFPDRPDSYAGEMP